jgi:hypothetical protein
MREEDAEIFSSLPLSLGLDRKRRRKKKLLEDYKF